MYSNNKWISMVRIEYVKNKHTHFRIGAPSYITANSYHYYDTELSRKNAPAMMNKTGHIYCNNGICHRENGPAVVYIGKNQIQIEYRINNDLHSTSGPARIVIDNDIKYEYYLNGEEYEYESWKTKIEL